jgi:TolB-like protein/DNA-binding winged helix-turn-helix (wHTH) protein
MASSPISTGIVRFGAFEADLHAGELRRDGVKVRLQDLPFRALTLLLSRPGVVVTREEIRQALWPPDIFVDFDQGISSAIMRLRDALGDSANNPIFIQTVERRGYRWIGPVLTQALQPVAPGLVLEAAPPPDEKIFAPAESVSSAPENQKSSEAQTTDFTARYEIALAAPNRRMAALHWWLVLGVVIVAGIAVAGFFLLRPRRLDPITSIAILPFDNLSSPAFDDAFSDGLTDEVASSISHLSGIRVAGRRSAYVFKGKHYDLREIGARLNVEAVVEGSVQRSGDRTHVTVELNRTRDGFTVWSQTYDGTTADWIQIESQIANSIARALARDFSTPDTPERDPEAHALYLEARYLWNQRTYASELKSVDLLQQAITRDPNYALAWAGLADSLIAIGDIEEVNPATYMPRARDAALKAMQLNPSLAEAHAAMGMVACHYDYDWPTAEREYKKAFELDPSYASAHQYYALGLMAHGRFAEAEQQLDVARRLDPLALIVDVDLALLRKFQRDFESAIAVSKSILQRDPNYRFAYSMLTISLFCEHRYDEYLAAMAKIPHDEGFATTEDFASSVARGWRDEQERLLRKAVDQASAGLRRPYDVASDAIETGNNELALEWLEKAYEHHDYWVLFVNVDPQWDSVRPDPRFQAIMQKLGVAR